MPETMIGYGVVRLMTETGLTRWQLRLARRRGLVPPPDIEGERWSAELVEHFAPRAAKIRSAVGDDPPIGAIKAAERLAVRAALDAEAADIEVLVLSGELPIADHYQGRPLYDVRDLDSLDPDRMAEVVAARKGPRFESVSPTGAAALLGWPKEVFVEVATRRSLTTDQFGRYALAEVRALADDSDLQTYAAERQRAAALASGRREESRAEQTIRHWLRDCSDYVAGTTTRSPDPATMTRALKSLIAARSTLQNNESAPIN